jgi:hypothetical protein
MFLKHHGSAAFPIRKSFFMSPVTKSEGKTVNLSLQSFPPEHFSLLKHRLLLGVGVGVGGEFSFHHYLQYPLISYPSTTQGNFPNKFATVSSLTSPDSPQASLSTIYAAF